MEIFRFLHAAYFPEITYGESEIPKTVTNLQNGATKDFARFFGIYKLF